jgi:LPS-assembly protein
MTRGGIFLAIVAWLAAFALTGEARAASPSGRPSASQPMLFTADEVQYDQQLGLTVAKGNVEISSGSQILLADTVTYNQRTDTVTATGHVSLLQPTGDIVFADFMELHDNLRDGFIKDIRILLSDSSRMAGNTARRTDGTRTEVRRGVYSPCELCQDDPTRPPLWQIKAERIVDDKSTETLEFHDAFMEFGGIPVFYTPYISTPDPEVKRASGFLPPSFGSGHDLGYNVTIPYFWAISPDKDLTLRPLFTTEAGEMLDAEYREAFTNGRLDYDGSIAYGSRAESGPPDNPTSDLKTVRGHLSGSSIFDLNDDWRAGLDVERQSDPTYLLRFHLPQPSDFLTTHAYAEDFGTNSYGNISAYSFQTLSTLSGDGSQPIVAPVANYDWTGDPDKIGGNLSVNGNLLNLERRTGPEMRRLSAGTSWRLPFNGPLGDRLAFSVSTRFDGYQSDNFQYGTGNAGNQSAASGRAFPQAALTWRYPWVRHAPGANELIEPMAAFVAAPNGGNPARIPDEDSSSFEFDETDLFRPNRLPGYDVVDSGQRVDYGLHTGIYNDTYGSSDMLVGQSYRMEKSSPFQVGSGLEDKLSDVVGRLSLSPSDTFDLFYRMRLDHEDLAMRRQEAGLNAGPSNLRLGVSFISATSIPGVTALQTGNQIGLNLSAALTRYWSLRLNDTRSLSIGGATVNSGATLTYQDDCFAIETSVQQSGIQVGDVTPGVSVMVTFVFKNLGQFDVHALTLGGSPSQ